MGQLGGCLLEQSAGFSAASRPRHLTFSSCPEEPHAEPPLTPRPKALGLKIARLLSPGEPGKEREGGQMPRLPLPQPPH